MTLDGKLFRRTKSGLREMLVSLPIMWHSYCPLEEVLRISVVLVCDRTSIVIVFKAILKLFFFSLRLF